MKISSLVLFTVALSAGSVCRADQLLNFTLNSTYSNDGSSSVGSVQGIVTIDVTSGTFEGASLTGSYDGVALSFDSNPTFQGAFSSHTSYGGFYYDTTDFYYLGILVYARGGSLVGFEGGPLCSYTDLNCIYIDGYPIVGFIQAPDGSFSDTLNGSLTPSTTPEPSSLILLATGAAGLLGVGRKRLFQS